MNEFRIHVYSLGAYCCVACRFECGLFKQSPTSCSEVILFAVTVFAFFFIDRCNVTFPNQCQANNLDQAELFQLNFQPSDCGRKFLHAKSGQPLTVARNLFMPSQASLWLWQEISSCQVRPVSDCGKKSLHAKTGQPLTVVGNLFMPSQASLCGKKSLHAKSDQPQRK